MAGLLALVADALAVAFRCAVTRDVADLAAYRYRQLSFLDERRDRTYSCSTSDPVCSHGPCGRIHRRSSRSAGDRQSHRDHRRSYRPESSCEQCVRPDRTCSIPGRQSHQRILLGSNHRCCRRRGLTVGNRGRCGRFDRSGSRISPWELGCIHG